MKQLLFFGLLLFVVMNAAGQTQEVDSLINELETNTKLTSHDEMELYDKICDILAFNDPQQTFMYANKGLKIAEKEKRFLMASYFNEYIGISYGLRKQGDSSILFLEKALDLALKAKDRKQETKLYINLGAANHSYNNLVKSLAYYMKAVELCDNTDNKKYKAMVLGNIGTIHLSLDNKTRAKYFLEQARELAEETDFPTAKIRAYCDLANIYRGDKEYDKALSYGWKTVDICKEVNNKNFQTTAMSILATTYYELQDYDKALACADTCLIIAEEFGDPSKIFTALMKLSDIYLKEKRYKDCETMALRAWQIDSAGTQILTLLFNLGMSNFFLDNKEKASYYMWKRKEMESAIADENYQETLMNMEVKYETEKKELRIASLEKERQLYLWLGIAGFLLAILLSITLLQKARSIRREKQLIATQSVLKGEMGERIRLSRDLHDRLSGNLSAMKIELNNSQTSLLNMQEKLDSCIEEIRRVAHNLMPVSLQYGLKVALKDFTAQFPNVQFHFFGEEQHIEEETAFVIYCCANELVNNAIKHAGAKNINLQLVQSDKYVSLTVQDDGDGFDEKKITKGLGLQNIYDRVISCNGKIDIATSPGKGTETTIELKTEKIGL